LFFNAFLHYFFRWGILLMYKKFLVSMLLTAALVGCNHQPSDKQGDQSDTAMPVQDQMANPANSSSPDEQIPVSPQAVEPTQTPPPSATTTPATQATPDTSSNNGMSTTTPAEPANNDNSANSAAGAQ
jgi:cytoskeletal protein RodZ